MEPITTTTLGLFAHYRPVLLALPQGGCRAVASFLDASSPQELSTIGRVPDCFSGPRPGGLP